MKRQRFGVASLLLVAVAACGCRGPHLANRAMTEEESRWTDFISTSYSAWKPPYMPPLQETTAASGIPESGAPASGLPALHLPQTQPPAGGLDLPVPIEPADEIELIPVDGGPAATQTYTVKRGDTLQGIARKFYGASDNWKRIYDANSTIIPAPDRLHPGLLLSIPPQTSVH